MIFPSNVFNVLKNKEGMFKVLENWKILNLGVVFLKRNNWFFFFFFFSLYFTLFPQQVFTYIVIVHIVK